MQIKICVLSPPAYYDLRVIRAEFLRHFPIDQVMAAYPLKNPYTLHLTSSKLLSLRHPASEQSKRPTDFGKHKQNISNGQMNKLKPSYIPHGLRHASNRGTKKSLTLFSSSDSVLKHAFWSSTSSPAKQSTKTAAFDR